MKRRLLLAGATTFATASTFTLSGCAAQKIDDYANETPLFNLPDYFNGVLDAYGVFTDRSGQVVKRFTVVMTCHWQGDEDVLDEAFAYADGSIQNRIWRLQKHADGRFTGHADDVVGQALGETQGNAFHWAYTLKLPVDGNVYEVQFDDWMYRMTDKVVLNKATMRKFGVRLGEVTLAFTKR
jgi:hypothetical protein